MDPFDEFEFKPLTDGLGFHKKKTEIKISTNLNDEEDEFASVLNEPRAKSTASKANSTALNSSTKSSFFPDQGLGLLDEASPSSLRSPLPRKNHKADSNSLELKNNQAPGFVNSSNFSSNILDIQESTATTAVDEILKSLQKNKRFEFENAKQSLREAAKAKQVVEYKATTWNFSASFLDAMLVVAASLLCMIILLAVTRVDLVGNLTHPDSSGWLYLSTATLFMGVSFIYMFLNRAALGCTPGEWAFDQRIGKPAEMKELSYIFKVAARTLLVCLTGFILFPILSLIFDKDLAGQITGATLYGKV